LPVETLFGARQDYVQFVGANVPLLKTFAASNVADLQDIKDLYVVFASRIGLIMSALDP
jgi:hypothetical protein